LSIRRREHRPVSVLVNAAVPVNPAYVDLFDKIILVPDDPPGAAPLRGAMNKLRLLDATPYARTLYVDADCLLFSPRIEFFWRRYRGQAFAVEGHKQSSGAAFTCSLGSKDAAELCRLFGVPFVTVFNAGVIYFERSDASKAVFERVREIYSGPHRDTVSYSYKHAGEYADEPFFGVALATLGIAPFEPPLTQRLQVTTPNLAEGEIDIDTGALNIVKRLPNGKPQLWSGVLCHFCGLDPMDIYFPIADKLRREAGLAAMERTRFQPVVLTQTQTSQAH
jgi:hypothetical protein